MDQARVSCISVSFLGVDDWAKLFLFIAINWLGSGKQSSDGQSLKALDWFFARNVFSQIAKISPIVIFPPTIWNNFLATIIFPSFSTHFWYLPVDRIIGQSYQHHRYSNSLTRVQSTSRPDSFSLGAAKIQRKPKGAWESPRDLSQTFFFWLPTSLSRDKSMHAVNQMICIQACLREEGRSQSDELTTQTYIS